MNTVFFYRTLSAEQKATLAVICHEVGYGASLEFLAYQVGRPSDLKEHESRQVREIVTARNVRFPRTL